MTEEEAKRLQCENAYLKDRCLLLEASVNDLEAKLHRMQEGQPHHRPAGASWLSDPLSTGQ
jgi:predicted nuclease with TOPRIM domain